MSDIEDKTVAKDTILAATPSVTVSVATVFGVPLQEWVYVVTILYTLVMTVKTLMDIIREAHRDNNNEKEQNIQGTGGSTKKSTRNNA